MMATYNSQVFGANDECDLLIGAKHNIDTINEDRFDSAIEECCLDDNSYDSSGLGLPFRQTPRPSLMKLLWSRVRSIVPGAGAESNGLGQDWTLDSGIIYRPGGGENSKNSMGISLNNSNQQQLSRGLFGRNWSGRSKKNKGHAFNKLTKDELNHRRLHHNHQPNPNQPYLKNGHNCRMLLKWTISLMFLAATLLVLVKLMNLLQESQRIERGQVFPTQLITKALDSFDNTSSLEDYEARNDGRWIVSSQKCRIPYIDPWHESIRDYIQLKPEFNCTEILITNKAKGQPAAALTYVSSNKLYFTEQAIRLGAVKDCCYRPLIRSEENDNDLDYTSECKPINEDGLKPSASIELIQVQCSQLKYTNVHAFVAHEPEEEEASRRVAAEKLKPTQYYNVVLVGVDTISRLNGLRQLSKTMSLLRDKFGALEFAGYNKVGENTFPNLIPFLTGLKPEQLTETQCWLASNYSQESESGDDFLDNCKYLWNFYRDLGYRTYFGEDWPAASTFNYLKQGFKRAPTNYYGRPFTIARDKLLLPPIKMGCTSPCLWDKSIVELDLFNLKNFIWENKAVPHFAFHWINCPQHDDLNGASRIDRLLEEFFKSIYEISQADRTFVIFFSDHGYRWDSFVSTQVGHYESSLPLLTIAPPKHFIENHPDLYENLKLYTSTLLTPFDMFKTLIDIRNLGIKSSQNRRVPGGKHKSDGRRKPHHKSAPPPSKTTKPTPVPSKVDELGYTIGPTARTTIQQIPMIDGLSYKQHFRTFSLLRRYSSDELHRSCIEAGIPDNYCVCHEFSNVPATTNDVLGAAYYLVYVHLYSRIKDHLKLCHILDLEKVHKAEYFDFKRMKSAKSKTGKRRRGVDQYGTNSTSRGSLLKTTPKPLDENEDLEEEANRKSEMYLPSGEYNIRFSTLPSGALFQEVVRFHGDDLEACESEVEKVKSIIEKSTMDYKSKHSHVLHMNKVCKFSVHSDSISRLNLYRDQSQCVKNNIEVKKVCYCNDLLNKT